MHPPLYDMEPMATLFRIATQPVSVNLPPHCSTEACPELLEAVLYKVGTHENIIYNTIYNTLICEYKNYRNLVPEYTILVVYLLFLQRYCDKIDCFRFTRECFCKVIALHNEI